MYGLAPNYECCTANFHQGYPKLVAHLFFTEPGANALVSTVWAPSTVVVPELGGGAEVELQTQYPFGTSVEYKIRNPKAFQLKIRLPPFLRESAGPDQGIATVHVFVDGHEQPVALKDGFLEYTVAAWPLAEPRVAVRVEWSVVPEVKKSDDPQQGASVFVGPLLMALDLGEQRRQTKSYAFGAADWDTTATLSQWTYGLGASGRLPSKPVFRAPGDTPMKHSATGCPLIMNATLALLPEGKWTTAHGAPGPLPSSPAGAVKEEELLMLPYACSAIRIAAFPLASGGGAEPIFVL